MLAIGPAPFRYAHHPCVGCRIAATADIIDDNRGEPLRTRIRGTWAPQPMIESIAKRAPREHRPDRPVQLSRATVARAFLSWDTVSVAKTASQENK